jgi:hypothetical protein
VTKERIPIPKETAADVLIAHDRTCCVCQERGKRVQIHHIDDNPSNNDPSNLAVLCFECHNETQIKGGFARSLDDNQVRKYRDEWVQRVADIKKKADEILLQKQVGIIAAATDAGEWRQPSLLEMTVYIESIPDTMQKAYNLAQAEWNKGNNADVTQATYQVTAIAERLWIGLSTWYRPNHFNDGEAEKYGSEYITERYNLRHALMEPEGPGTGGSMMRPMIAYGVLLDVQQLIVLTVQMMVSFSELASKINLDGWEKRFSDATNSYSQ